MAEAKNETGAGDVRSRRRAQTRAEILRAAWDLVRQDGFAALSLRELGAAIGMRAPSLYTYFGSKNEILDAMYAQGMGQFAEAMVNSPPGRSPREALRNRARTFVRMAVEDPTRYELLFHRPIPGFVPSPESLAIGLAGMAATRQSAEAAGLKSQAGFDLFMAMTRGLVAMQLANEPAGDRWIGLVDDAVDLLVDHHASVGRASRKKRS